MLFPVRLIDDGLPPALWKMDSVADFVPSEVGVKDTYTVWLCPAATVAVGGDTEN